MPFAAIWLVVAIPSGKATNIRMAMVLFFINPSSIEWIPDTFYKHVPSSALLCLAGVEYSPQYVGSTFEVRPLTKNAPSKSITLLIWPPRAAAENSRSLNPITLVLATIDTVDSTLHQWHQP
jgi:hypothetical protein